MNQSYTTQQLLKFCSKSEVFDHRLRRPDLIRIIDNAVSQINNKSFSFNFYQVNDFFLTDDLVEKLILRKLHDILKRIYKEEQSNRRIIISQIKALLEETCPMYILKTDIESFYESIDKNRLLSKLKDDGIISYHSFFLLNSIFSHPQLINVKGIPRGLNISSTLSEIYMRKFDRWVKRHEGVYFYARYVDDIIIFTNIKEVAEKISTEINSNLEMGLVKKESKTAIFSIQSELKKPIEYLGYKFTVRKRNKDTKKVIISIADKKVNKIKTRIVNSYLDYNKNKDFGLLESRIKFLTGNFNIKTNNEGNKLKAGIYYNYSFINDYSVLNNLNVFHHKLLCSANSNIGRKLNANLSPAQKIILSKYSFIHGHKNKVCYSFKPEKINQIKRCWI